MRPIIKAIVFILTITLFIQCEKNASSPEVEISDKYFLNALIELGVDRDGDGVVRINEVEEITYLDICGDSIQNLAGIESFVSLDSLDCSDNFLTNLDLRGNEKLIYLECSNNFTITSLDISNNPLLENLYCNQNSLSSLDCSDNPKLEILELCFNLLTTLNVTGNPELRYLDCACYSNMLTSLDLSNNPKLEVLNCMSNDITSLDLSNNTMLEYLYCSYNNLTSLDISNNTDLQYLGIGGMHSLSKVCVWEMPFPPSGVSISTFDSPNVYFTLDCSK